MIELPRTRRKDGRYTSLGFEDNDGQAMEPYSDDFGNNDDDEYGIPTNVLRSEYQRERPRPRVFSWRWLIAGAFIVTVVLVVLTKKNSAADNHSNPTSEHKTSHSGYDDAFSQENLTPVSLGGTGVNEKDGNSGLWGVNEASNPEESNSQVGSTNRPSQSPTAEPFVGPGKWIFDDEDETDKKPDEAVPDAANTSDEGGDIDKEPESIEDDNDASSILESTQASAISPAPTSNGEPTVGGAIWGEPVKETTATLPADDNNPQAEETDSPSPSEKPTKSPSMPQSDEATNVDAKEDDASVSSTKGDMTQPGTAPYQYRRRGRPISPDEAKQLAEKWGQWDFVDLKAGGRPTEDYCGRYPNRDIPWSEFPSNAWQVDEDHVSKFLAAGKDLVMRAMEVHLAEYGFGPDDMPSEDFEARVELSPFAMEIVKNGDKERRRKLSNGVNDRAGWAPQKSWDGLVRRLLHAVVSGSDFNLVLGGHSAAAGHGNHFQQSYSLQFQRVMEPVLARLGIKHYSRNTGMGGLGTIQSVMGARDLYGSDVDILIWDSSMTESSKSSDFDLYARQGILGSYRAPILWAGVDETELYPSLQEHADIDYMMYGTGRGPIPTLTDPTKLDEIPWAARYLKCDPDWESFCKDNRYNGTCWIPRDDFEPWTPQKAELGGKASWHDGNREHQIYGRTMSFTVLKALYEALDVWEKQPKHELTDGMWHMTDYYANIHQKIANLDPDIGSCYGIEDRLPTAWCTTPFQSKSEFTPRANPEQTSIRSIMKPFGPDRVIPQPELNIYDPPDVYNPTIGVPEGEIDYLAIIENGVDYTLFDAPTPVLPPESTNNRLIELTVDDKGEAIVPGLGWGINTKASPHLCNGTYDSFCGRSGDQECLLYGHNDYRGGLTFDSLSGWGIFTLRNLKHGLIFVKMDSWRQTKDNPVTEGWTAENNGTGVRSLSSLPNDERSSDGGLQRKAKDDNQNFCPELLLEFAFGDTVVRIPSEDILGERHSLVQRVVQIWTVMNDSDFAQGETVDIELGVRLRGCGRQHVFWLSTIYWA